MLLMMGFLSYCDSSLWTLIIVKSNSIRIFFHNSYKKSLINDDEIKQMNQFLLIEPISKMQRRNNIDRIIKNFSFTGQKREQICWSHAISTAIYLAQSRIVCQYVEPFLQIRDNLLRHFKSTTNLV